METKNENPKIQGTAVVTGKPVLPEENKTEKKNQAPQLTPEQVKQLEWQTKQTKLTAGKVLALNQKEIRIANQGLKEMAEPNFTLQELPPQLSALCNMSADMRFVYMKPIKKLLRSIHVSIFDFSEEAKKYRKTLRVYTTKVMRKDTQPDLPMCDLGSVLAEFFHYNIVYHSGSISGKQYKILMDIKTSIKDQFEKSIARKERTIERCNIILNTK